MSASEISAQILQLDDQLSSLDAKISRLRQQRQLLQEKKLQLEKALKHRSSLVTTDGGEVSWSGETFPWSEPLRFNKF